MTGAVIDAKAFFIIIRRVRCAAKIEKAVVFSAARKISAGW